MDCQTCNALLDGYKRAVAVFKNAVQNSRGAAGDDSRLAGKNAAFLAQACKESNEALMAHWREHHRGLAVKEGRS